VCVETFVPGDTLVVWRWDRLGHAMAHVVTVIAPRRQQQVRCRARCDGAIETTTVTGA
jgi:DNA invertase Pin-like site-specific DNA recombinase